MTSRRFYMLFVPVLLFSLAGALPGQSKDWRDLLPDPNLKGWTRIPIPPIDGLKPKMQWRVDPAARTLICSGDGGHEWLRYDQILSDFVLEVDWRFTPRETGATRYNSGIGIRLSQYGEIWYQAQAGASGNFLFGDNLVDGAIKRFNLGKETKENRLKNPGEWNHYEIRVQGDKITLMVNGGQVSEVSGIALRHGYIGLEAEGYEITFKNIRVKEL